MLKYYYKYRIRFFFLDHANKATPEIDKMQQCAILYLFKVEKILNGNLDSISSPSVKIQIMGGKVCLRRKGKTLLDIVNKHFVFKSLMKQITVRSAI